MKTLVAGLVCMMLVMFSAVVVVQAPAYAVDVIAPACQNADPNNLPSICKDAAAGATSNKNPLVGPNGILTRYIKILALIVGLGAVIMIIISGLRLIISGGDPQSVSSARNGILYAGVGLVIALFAQAIVSFVLGRL